MRFGPDGVLLDVAVGASGMTGAVAHMVVRKMGPGKAASGHERPWGMWPRRTCI